MRGMDLGFSDEKGLRAFGADEAEGGGQDLREALDGAKGDDIVRRAGGEILGAAREDGGIFEIKSANDLAEEGDFLLI